MYILPARLGECLVPLWSNLAPYPASVGPENFPPTQHRDASQSHTEKQNVEAHKSPSHHAYLRVVCTRYNRVDAIEQCPKKKEELHTLPR